MQKRLTRHIVSRYRTRAALLVLAATAVLGVASPAPAAPRIQWSPSGVSETVAPGGRRTVVVWFSSTEDLAHVSVSLAPGLAPYVSAAPSFFASMSAGATANVTLTFSSPIDATPGAAFDGTLHLRDGGESGRTYARPLPVTVRIGPNHPPVADAGPDQTSGVLAGDAVILDGSASSDADAQPLTYSWSLMVVPAGSTAQLSDPTVANPEFVADEPGMYTARLTVNDGLVDSASDEVSITVVVPPPVVDISAPEDLSVVTASPVAVKGSVDDPNATIMVNGIPVANNGGNYTANVALLEGSNTVTVVAQNSTGDGRASIDVILNTTDHPALKVTSPGSDFIVGEEFAVGAPFPASTQVAVAGVIKVNTRALFPALNRPTVTVNGVTADVSLHLFFSECGLINPFQCWRFTATIALGQGTPRTIRAVGTDVQNRSTTVDIGGTVDYCRVGLWSGNDPTDIGKDPGVLALAGPAAGVQGNRCHEIDGCSAPVLGEFANDPLPLAICKVASTEFGAGTIPPSEHFVHGLKSQFNRPCNNHDVCYQTCVDVTGLSEAEREERWRAAWHACNAQQYDATLDVCRRAYPGLCSGPCFPAACGVYLDEKRRCFNRALFYFAGVETSAGFDRFRERQAHYCAN